MTEQLKPCPFCGGEPILHDGKGNPAGEYWVGCKCDTTAMSAKRAIQLWNTRQAELPRLDEEAVEKYFTNMQIRSDIHPDDHKRWAEDLCSKFSPKVLSVEKIEEIIDQPIREYNMERLNIKGLKQAIATSFHQLLKEGI